MNIPAMTSVTNAIRIYYEYPELGNKEITELFGKHSSATVAKLKNAVKEEMIKQEVLSHGMNKINTEIAYQVWQIDVDDLERRVKKLRSLKMGEFAEQVEQQAG